MKNFQIPPILSFESSTHIYTQINNIHTVCVNGIVLCRLVCDLFSSLNKMLWTPFYVVDYSFTSEMLMPAYNSIV